MAVGRPLNYYEFIGPVKTPDEQQLFHQLMSMHSSSSSSGEGGRVSDWSAFTRDWNLQAFANLAGCGHQVITFKQAAHLKAYSKSLAKAAGQLHAAAMASHQHPQQPQEQQSEEASDTAAVIAALQQILQDCLQHHEGDAVVLQLPDILQQLLNRSLGSQAAPKACIGGSNREPVPAAAAEAAAAAAAPEAAAAAGGVVATSTPGAAAGGVVGDEGLAAEAAAEPRGVAGVLRDGASNTAAPSAGQPAAVAAVAAAVVAAGAVQAAPQAGSTQSAAGAAGEAFANLFKGKTAAAAAAATARGPRVSKATGKAILTGVQGVGRGGATRAKVCVPCTAVQYGLTTMEAAMKHTNPVCMLGPHQPTGSDPCKYCKCKECKKYWWSQSGKKVLTPKRSPSWLIAPTRRGHNPAAAAAAAGQTCHAVT
jgi:hypothetical protein